ncbi:MAG: endopeptidase La [Clostridia bacterium]|nr:endopeptidase La [Clostridia bacterium]
MSITIEKLQPIKGYKLEEVGRLPILPLRGLVIFPGTVTHIELGRSICISAVNEAMESNRLIFVTAQSNSLTGSPKAKDLYKIGTLAKVVQTVRQHDNTLKVVVEGVARAVAYDIKTAPMNMKADIVKYTPEQSEPTLEQIARMRLIKVIFSDYAKLMPKMPKDIEYRVKMENSPEKMTNFVAANSIIDFEAKQTILEEFDVEKRLDIMIEMLRSDIEIISLQHKIIERTNERMDDGQKEYFLHEQLKAIHEELGEDDMEEEAEEFIEQINELEVSEEVREALLKECSRLKKLPDASQEAFALRTYIETCLELPWSEMSKDRIDIKAVEKSLDRHHYGLEKVKERIIEYLAVRKLSPDVKGQILCFVGPPGVGKTSIAESIGKAINRKVERIALGGVHDEAEIRGHRRTYVASMPGRIISALKNAKTCNPLIILDEVDKLAADYKGDPTSALLEVLDPEQNYDFRDHYIDLPFDLSRVMFITTANDKNEIPAPLLDRMELIEIGSYTREEKFHIAKKHLIPKQIKNCGLTSSNLKMSSSAVYAMIDGYTSEAGVRNLERTIAAVMRKTAAKVASGEDDKMFKIDAKNIEEYLGPRKYKDETLPETNTVGLVNGLAWTSVGGVTLPIEVAAVAGTGKIELTGSLGDVMKESAKIAVTCVRTRAAALGIDSDFYKNLDIHIHALEGAVPKDGPSAGITMTTAIVSALLNKPVNRFVAMTGEVSLRGSVLPIGGLKEKAMGAFKAGVKIIIIPKKNESDIAEIDETIKESVNIIPVETIDEVFEIAFTLDSTYEKNIENQTEKKQPKKRKTKSKTDTAGEQTQSEQPVV